MKLPHFVPADWPFTCSECDEVQPCDALKMVYYERVSQGGRVRQVRRVYCKDCGEFLLDSLTMGSWEVT